LQDEEKRQNSETIGIEDFRGDFQEVSRMIERSWAENSYQPLLYEPDFLASCFDYPAARYSLAPTIYKSDEPLAFGAVLPRRVRLAGRDLNLGINAFLTSASDYKKRGYGLIVWDELVKRARAAGLDGMLNYCMEGEAMNGIISGCCRMLKLPTAHAYVVHYWSRMLQSRNTESAAENTGANLVEHFIELTASLADRTPLARLWSLDEADWQCHRRFGAVVAEIERGQRRGILTGYVMTIANASRTKCLMIDDVLWGDLEAPERSKLVRVLLDRAALAGAQVAVLPVLGYADLSPFHEARFRPSRQVLHAYLTVWNGEPFTEPLSSMYIDVI
jgi:hypothetical protein